MPESLRTLLDNALDQLLAIGFGVLEAIVIFLLAYAVARLVRRPIRRRLDRAAVSDSARVLVLRSIPLAVYLAATTLLFSLWGLTWSGLIAAIGLGTLAVGLGLQNVLQSFAAGIVILFERPYAVGDRISFVGQNIEGKVEDITFRATVVRTDDGDRVVTPNSLIFTTSVINRSPQRPVRTVITLSGLTGSLTAAKDKARATLADLPSLASSLEIRRRPSVVTLRLPRVFDSGKDGESAAKPTRPRAIRTQQLQVMWSGPDDEAVREDVIRRLREAFPEARVSVRRWRL
ncbi:MAG TPA: mechanosensitive ion channel domain-containing protein [Thermomicrobiales bacterium]